MKKELEEKPEEFLAWFERTTSKLVGARNLVPETMWEGYKLLNLTGLQEQDIFYDERRVLLNLIKERYPKPEKKTNGNAATAPQESK